MKTEIYKFVDKVAEELSKRLSLPITTFSRKEFVEKYGSSIYYYYRGPIIPIHAGRILVLEAINYLIAVTAGSRYWKRKDNPDRHVIFNGKKTSYRLELVRFGAKVFINNKRLSLVPNENGTGLNHFNEFDINAKLDIDLNANVGGEINRIIYIIENIKPIDLQKLTDEACEKHKNDWFQEEEYTKFKFKPINNNYIIGCKFFLDHKGIGRVSIPGTKVRFSGDIEYLDSNNVVHTVQAYFNIKKRKIYRSTDNVDITNNFDNFKSLFKNLN